MHISGVWNVLEQFKTQYQKHYANYADELKRYDLFKKSKANVAKLNELNPEPVFGITSMSNSMMIKNIIMKELIWINRVINETTFETHYEATGYFLPIRQYRNVDDCRVHTCVPHGTCVDGVNSDSYYCDPGFQETEVDRVKFDFIHTTNAQNVSYMFKVNEFASLTTSDSVSRMKCGHPGNMLVDVVSKSFPDVVKVVQKLGNTVFGLCPGAQGDKPSNVWSGLKHLRIPEHGKWSDPWSKL